MAKAYAVCRCAGCTVGIPAERVLCALHNQSLTPARRRLMFAAIDGPESPDDCGEGQAAPSDAEHCEALERIDGALEELFAELSASAAAATKN